MAPNKFGDGLRRRVKWLPGGLKDKSSGNDEQRSRDVPSVAHPLQHDPADDHHDAHYSATAPAKARAPLSAKAALRLLLSSPAFVLVMLVVTLYSLFGEDIRTSLLERP